MPRSRRVIERELATLLHALPPQVLAFCAPVRANSTPARWRTPDRTRLARAMPVVVAADAPMAFPRLDAGPRQWTATATASRSRPRRSP
jgi:hypothetical protein